ncbi:lysostaphin resistance A-like protein [Flavobacterium sp.]|uniref:lysostaphin resistance A-like protein n=1 Tax=Flavobacterium sp. TaxID=239 RepID=UPI004047B9C2
MIKTNEVLKYIGVIGVSLFYMILLIFAQLSFQTTVENENAKLMIALGMGIFFPLFIYFLNHIYFNYVNLEPPKLLKLNQKLIKKIMIGVIIGLLALYISGLIFYFQTKDIANFFFKVSFNLVIFNILTAIGEEIIFRGTLLNFFVQKRNQYIGLVISSLLFASIHLLNMLMGQEIGLSFLLTLTLAGLFLGLIYLNFGLVSAIATHYIWNLLHAGANFNEQSGYTVQIVLTLLCIGLFYINWKNSNAEKMPAANS